MNEQVYSGFLYIMYMCIFWALRDLDLNSYLLFFFFSCILFDWAETKGRYTFECPTIGGLHPPYRSFQEWVVHLVAVSGLHIHLLLSSFSSQVGFSLHSPICSLFPQVPARHRSPASTWVVPLPLPSSLSTTAPSTPPAPSKSASSAQASQG